MTTPEDTDKTIEKIVEQLLCMPGLSQLELLRKLNIKSRTTHDLVVKRLQEVRNL